jgi:hypothetical protein
MLSSALISFSNALAIRMTVDAVAISLGSWQDLTN